MTSLPCLRLAIHRLEGLEPRHYAIWVLNAPYPGGYVHHNRVWTDSLTKTWQAWQSFFPLRGVPSVPFVSSAYTPSIPEFNPDTATPAGGQPTSQTARLMQQLGVSLWQWLFDGPIQSSLNQSQGIAMGQGRPLRLRLEVRDPELITLPWEIMQPQPGRPAISLSNQQVLFSRTTSDVDSLPPQRSEQVLRILLVLGHNPELQSLQSGRGARRYLNLEQEAASLARLLESAGEVDGYSNAVNPVACLVKTLIEPTPGELINNLET